MPNVSERLSVVFQRMEKFDLRVADIWLHPNQGEELRGDPNFDVVASGHVRRALIEECGGIYHGLLFGARVFITEAVPEDHVAIIPSGFHAKLIDRTACVPF